VPYMIGVIGQQTSIRVAMISPAILFLAIVAIFWRLERPAVVGAAIDDRPGPHIA